MNEFKENIFYKTYPRIDLHGMTSDIAEVYINDFISENLKLGNEYIIIIHGIGKGILSKKTEYILKQNKNVIYYRKDYFNLGITLAKLNVDKCHKMWYYILTSKKKTKCIQKNVINIIDIS